MELTLTLRKRPSASPAAPAEPKPRSKAQAGVAAGPGEDQCDARLAASFNQSVQIDGGDSWRGDGHIQ